VQSVNDTSNGSSGPTIVDCGSGNHATGGGAVQRGTFVIGDHLIANFPSDAAGTPVADASTNPRYWTARYELHDGGATDGWTIFALCTPDPS
jgi:hypothetical protein